MKSKVVLNLLLAAVLPTVASTAVASTTWYVDGVNGSDTNDCTSATTACKTIGHAISMASSGDTIMVARAVYFENLRISFSLNVTGAGEGRTIVDGGQGATVVTISNTAAHVSLSKVTIRNGFGTNGMGGGIYNSGTLTISESTLSGNIAQIKSHPVEGGGIYNAGVLTINDSTIRGNDASIYGVSASGGGIYNNSYGTVTINNTTISENSAVCTPPKNGFGCSASGGGIANLGALTINNSTLSGNGSGYHNCAPRCGAGSGGIGNGGTLTINNSTVSGNSTDGSGGGIGNGSGTAAINNSTLSGNSALSGGGIDNGGTVTLQNTIVANSTSGGNCSGTMTSNGYNLSSDNTCNFNGPGDMNNTDPKLGPLQRNGGPTPTMALPSGSPAVDGGNPAGCTDGLGHLLKTDQRGKPRPDKEDTGGCDMGAYERQSD